MPASNAKTSPAATDKDGKTKVTAHLLFDSATLRDNVAAEDGAVEGLDQTLERFAEQLVRTPPGDQEFVITRLFDAPRDLVWKAFTELRPGGVFHHFMRSAQGQEMWGKFVYREIVPPECMLFVNSFSDDAGNTIRAPFNPNWPLEILNIVTFTEDAGRTTLTLRGGPVNATEKKHKTFHAARKLMEAGFTGTLDQLAAYLASQQGRS
jgi:uncharacterized protein YndB with AHSA1/START domain